MGERTALWEARKTVSEKRQDTLGYLICISFAMGSLLFVEGCIFDIRSDKLTRTQKRGSIDDPFLIGSILYTVGCYAGLLRAINLGRSDTEPYVWWRWTMPATNQEPHVRFSERNTLLFWGYLNFTLGALFFNICMTASVLPLDSTLLSGWIVPTFVYAPAVAGSMLFVIGSHYHTQISSKRECLSGKVCDLEWHLLVQNLLGSYFFLIAASFGLWGSIFGSTMGHSARESQKHDLTFFMMNSNTVHIKIPYLIGSAYFLVAAILELWLWKRDRLKQMVQEGPGPSQAVEFLVVEDGKDSTLIRRGPYYSTSAEDDEDRERSRGRGITSRYSETIFCGSTTCDVAAVCIYMLACTASVMDLTFVCLTKPSDEAVAWWADPLSRASRTALDAVAVFMLTAGALVLAAVLHQPPTQLQQRAHHSSRIPDPLPLLLLQGLRLAVVIFGVSKTIEAATWFSAIGDIDDK